MIEDSSGVFWLVGRYRNHGDSRTGLGMGERGLELAIFRSEDRGASFEKVVSFPKSELGVGDRDVLSIEGCALRHSSRGVELYVSTEKSGIGYPEGLESYLKPGTGVWTIERIEAASPAELAATNIKTILEAHDPQYVHVKDPFVANLAGQDYLLFCSHPFSWSSSNTAYVPIDDNGPQQEPCFDFFPRGFTWDVAITRGTAIVSLPTSLVQSDDGQPVHLMFYDGGESLRNLDEHKSAVSRPRGYSCEELGGLAMITGNDINSIQRISTNLPSFISPYGTGCSRYVDVLVSEDGFYATWQQSQDDLSQPLVMNHLSMEEARDLLAS